MNVIYEECVTGVEDCTSLPRARGKVVWVDETGNIPSHIKQMFHKTPVEENIYGIKDALRKFFESRGYVFFDVCYYRYKLGKNKQIKEFALNFHHIK